MEMAAAFPTWKATGYAAGYGLAVIVAQTAESLGGVAAAWGPTGGVILAMLLSWRVMRAAFVDAGQRDRDAADDAAERLREAREAWALERTQLLTRISELEERLDQ